MVRILLHPMIVHFPLALLFFSVVLDLIAVLKKRTELLTASLYCHIGGVVGGALAIGTGFLAGRTLEIKRLTWLAEAIKTGTNQSTLPDFVEQTRRTLEMHTLAGIYGVGVFAALLFWRIRWREQMRGAALSFYLAGALMAFGLLFLTGALGGVLGHDLSPRVTFFAPRSP